MSSGRRIPPAVLALATALALAAAFVTAAGCSSVELPATEVSRAASERARAEITVYDSIIARAAAPLPRGRDLILRVRRTALNVVLTPLVRQRSEDVIAVFRPTRPLVKEEKSILGIPYTNTIDIDTGRLSLNITAFSFDAADENTLEAWLEIDGSGSIDVSGRYTGVPASARPDVRLHLGEKIRFDVAQLPGGAVVLKPRPAVLQLHATFAISLLAWKLPWSQDIPLQAADLIAPIPVPAAFMTEVPFPIPAGKSGSEYIEYAPYRVIWSNSSFSTRKGILELSSTVDFQRK
jgi:hypothetical protein